MNAKLIDLGIVVVNWIIERSKNDPITAGKIERGESLTVEDLQRLGDARDDALAELEGELEETDF